MSGVSLRLPVLASLAGLAAALLVGCAVSDGGYSYGSFGVDYYEPYGYRYGGWGPGYRVAPFPGGRHFGYANGFPHGFRAPPPGRPVPSLPGGRFGGPGGVHIGGPVGGHFGGRP